MKQKEPANFDGFVHCEQVEVQIQNVKMQICKLSNQNLVRLSENK